MKSKYFFKSGNNIIEFLYNDQKYVDKYLDVIKQAQKTLFLQTYIFQNDDFGQKVIEELILAAQRGVHVYILIDAVGSIDFDVGEEMRLVKAGVHFSRFNGMQLKWIYRWGRRLHHKILLSDQSEAIIGGINIQSPCDDGIEFPRLDFAVSLKGPINFQLIQYCQSVFKKNYSKNIHVKQFHDETVSYANGLDAVVSVNDWAYGRNEISKQYLSFTTRAQEKITIINSYFFPRRRFMKQLVAAVKRGVQVRLILPTLSDWPSNILASEYLYDYFLKNGVEIYQWKISLMHGKLALIDNKWSIVGSYNLNYTSYQFNLEMNVNIHSQEFTSQLNQQIEQDIIDQCQKVDPREFNEKSSLRVRLLRFVYYILLSVISNLSIGLTFQEEPHRFGQAYNILTVIISIILFIIGVIGIILPIMPGIPFLAISFVLIHRQFILNRRRGKV